MRYFVIELAGLLVYGGLSLLVGWLARSMMNRSVIGWTLLSLMFTPIVSFIFLTVAGRLPTVDVKEEVRELVEETRRRRLADTERRAEHTCPSCGSPINTATRKGVVASAEEPWRISCANCSHELDGARW